MCVNRTPIAGDIRIARDRRDIDLFGCGLHHTVAKAPEAAHFDICVNITTPYMPITSDGKEPDLMPFFDAIATALAKAVRKAHRPAGNGTSQKDIVLDNLDAVIAEVSGDGEYRFNARQLFYALRPIVMAGAWRRAEDRQLHQHHHRLRERERRDRRHVPRAARLDLPSAPRRDHYPRHA